MDASALRQRLMQSADAGPFSSASSELSALLHDSRVRHRLYLCGKGTFLSPYWLDIGDFAVLAGMAAALHDAAPTVACCLNARLYRVDRFSVGWRSRLRETCELLALINEKLSGEANVVNAALPGSGGRGHERLPLDRLGRHAAHTRADDDDGPMALALVHTPCKERRKRFALLVGSGTPSEWELPAGCELLTPARCTRELKLPNFTASRTSLAAAVFAGTLPPHRRPGCAALLLLLLLLLELLLNVFLLGALCADPDSNSDRCAATVLLPPFAGVLSPLVGLAFLLRVMLVQLRAADGADAATRELSVGAPGRLLHTLALWNACSTVNALVALPFAASLPPAYLSPVPPVVLPLALVATKLVSAQAIKGLATSVGLTPAAWSLLDVIEADGGGDKGLAFAEGGDRHTP